MQNEAGKDGAKVVGVLLGLAFVSLVVLDLLDDRSSCVGELSASMETVLNGYPWEDLVKEAEAAGFDTRGEYEHPLVKNDGSPGNAKASIHRVNKSGSRKATCFDDKPIVVAKINSSGGFADLSLAAGDNYFVVWHNTAEDEAVAWHGAMLNATSRTPITFKYEEHWKKVTKPGNPDDETTPPAELAPQFDACWNSATPTRRACFAEAIATTPTGSGMGLGLWLRQAGSEPWVSCSQYGCCCGGTACHDGGKQ